MVNRDDRNAIDREESELARRARAGDESAFDLLFERYFARAARYFRELPPARAREAIREALEQLFAALDTTGDRTLAEEAYRIVRASPHAVEFDASREEIQRNARKGQG